MGDGFGKKVDSEMEITQRAELGEDKPVELPALEVVWRCRGREWRWRLWGLRGRGIKR